LLCCIHHPEVPTTRRCEICAEPFCHACLEMFDPVGAVCTECEALLERVEPEMLPERLEAIRAEVRKQVPPITHWWAWEIPFWVVALLPTLLVAAHLYGQFQYHQMLAFVSQEPLLPGRVVDQLSTISAALEKHHASHGSYPASLEGLQPTELPDRTRLLDPYSLQQEPLIYQLQDGRYRLCSRGPDRNNSHGVPLDRFSRSGDLCLGDAS